MIHSLNSHIPLSSTVTNAFRVSASTLVLEVGDVIFKLRWFLLTAVALIIADLWFGIRVSKMKKLKIRWSTAGRRTLNKILDYILYIVVGSTIAMALANSWSFDPIYVASAILILCYGFEIDSIYSHICELHGVHKKLSVFKIIWCIITFRFKDLTQIDTEAATKQIENLEIKENKN